MFIKKGQISGTRFFLQFLLSTPMASLSLFRLVHLVFVPTLAILHILSPGSFSLSFIATQ